MPRPHDEEIEQAQQTLVATDRVNTGPNVINQRLDAHGVILANLAENKSGTDYNRAFSAALRDICRKLARS